MEHPSAAPRRRAVRALAIVATVVVASVLLGSGALMVRNATAAAAEDGVQGIIDAAREAANGPAEVVAADYHPLAPLPRHHDTSVAVVDRVRNYHIQPAPLDDAASRRVFERYLVRLDPRRLHFLAADVAALGKYEDTLDEALAEGDLAPAFDIYNTFRRRRLERVEFETALLAQGIDAFDFTLDEAVRTDHADAPWPESRAALENLWRLALKSRVLSSRLAGETAETTADVLAKRVKSRLRGIRQMRSEDVFRIYINAFASTYDRHTQYFSPRDSEAFNISMSLSLEGIGAVLGVDGDHIVVEQLVPGGPADRAGELRPADRIVAVSQSQREPFVDIVGWRTDDVVQLIRGPKDSPVLLKVIPAGADASVTQVVEIVRNVVQLEDQAVSKTMLTIPQGGREYRVGVIDVPIFYLDFEGVQAGEPDAKSTTRDVALLIDELKADGVDALIVDVRSNGGGSLQEAVALTGLFMDSGPVVQVSNLSRPPTRHRDTDGEAAWTGPLAVMVNHLSASASEIFAGAVQDHGIGVVVGARTFGKGTVQVLLDLRRGQLKLTRQKFFRVSGEGTDQNGVTPDIAYPLPTFLPRTLLEGDGDGAIALPGDRVEPATFQVADAVRPFLDTLRTRHEERVASDPEFVYLRGWRAHTEELQERDSLSLNEARRRADRDAMDQKILELENARLTAKGETPVTSLDELNTRRRERNAEEGPSLADDPLVRETANILIDYIALARLQIAQADTAPDSANAPGSADAQQAAVH